MEKLLEQIVFDPIMGMIIKAGILMLVIIPISRFIKSRSTRFVKNVDVRYRVMESGNEIEFASATFELVSASGINVTVRSPKQE